LIVSWIYHTSRTDQTCCYKVKFFHF
jgi:hypothetical protein